MKQATLCFLLDANNGKPRVLLGMKKRGYGIRKWNGFGGKIKEGETPETAALRELQEECGVVVNEKDLKKSAEIEFTTVNHPEFNIFVHVFVAHGWKGKPIETEEMKPQWFETKKIPFNQMWEDDAHWLPLVLKGKKISAEFIFEEDDETIKEFQIREKKEKP